MFNLILVAVDNRRNSQSIVNDAIALAKGVGAKIFLLHVLSPLENLYSQLGYIDDEYLDPIIYADTQNWETLKTEGLELLNEFRTQVANQGVDVESRLLIGSPGKMICSFAKYNDINLIIMGRRGRSGFSEVFLGSVSNYVVHHASCSVLAVQGQEYKSDVDFNATGQEVRA